MTEFKLPELGEGIDKAEIIRILVSEGDTVAPEQSVMEVESEKAAAPLPCSIGGKVVKIHVKEGDTIRVGQTLITLEETAQKPADKKPTEKHIERPEAKKAPTEKAKPGMQDKPEPKPKEERSAALVAAGPATRRLARELGVSLQDIRGTGREGRITRDDVQSAARQPTGASHDGKAPNLPDFAHWGPVREERLNKLARTASERLSLSWRLVPHVTQHDQADITDLEAARQRLVQSRAEKEPKITMTALAVKVLIPVLKAYPRFNSSLDVERATLLIKEYYHVGVAVDTEEGLLVPVLRDVDKKTIRELAAELAELADTARRRQLQVGQMHGGTFTITNLGGIGGTAFTPIINYPEVAILGLSQATWQPRWIDNEPKNRLILPLSLSYDHRVINGADAARFLRKLAGLLADPLLWLVDM